MYLKFQDTPPSAFPESIRDILIAKILTTKSLTTNEGTSIKESLKQVEQSHNTLENKPLIVITAGKKNDGPEESKKEMEEFEKVWLICQKELAQQSQVCKQVTAQQSGHMINHEQPEIIVDAIREMVDEYRKVYSQLKEPLHEHIND